MSGDPPYRDDREADRARIDSLESELASAKNKIAELEGQSQALVVAAKQGLSRTGKSTSAAKWFGAPLTTDLVQTWDGEYSLDKVEDLLERIRQLTGDRGRVELLKTSMTWSSSKQPGQGVGPFYEIRISVKNGHTTLEMSDRLGPLAGIVFGALGGGVGGGAMALPIFASIAMPVLTPVFVIGWLGGFYGGLRAIFKRQANKRIAKTVQVFTQVCAAIEADLKTAS